jgi:hypothetical protein
MKSNLKIFGGRILCFLFAIFLTACGSGGGGGGDDGNGGNVQSLGRVDITDAKTLALVSQSSSQASAKVSSGATASSANRDILYKVTKDGLLIEVRFYDKQGNKIDSTLFSPRKIIDLTKDYLYVEFAPDDPIDWFRFFVRKSDGAVFQAPAPRDHRDTLGIVQFFYTERTTATIGDGNIYYPTNTCWDCGSSLNRIDIRDSANLIDIQVSPASDSLDRLGDVPLVDASGNILYFGSAGNISVVRLIKPDGSMSNLSGMFPISGDHGDSARTFLGPTGNIYYINGSGILDENGQAQFTSSVYELTVDNGGMPSFNLFAEQSGDPLKFCCSNVKRKYLHVGGKVIGVYMDKAIIGEVYNTTGNFLFQPNIGLPMVEVYDAQVSNAYYFLFVKKDISGARGLYRVNADTHAASELSLTSNYEIYNFKVVSDNEVIFHALRYSNGADVIGTINQLNEVIIISEVVGHPAVTLVRVL